MLDRIEVNRRSSAEIAFAAFTDGDKPKKNLDDLNLEAFALDRDLLNLDSAIAEAERRHHAACAEQAGRRKSGAEPHWRGSGFQSLRG